MKVNLPLRTDRVKMKNLKNLGWFIPPIVFQEQTYDVYIKTKRFFCPGTLLIFDVFFFFLHTVKTQQLSPYVHYDVHYVMSNIKPLRTAVNSENC